MVKYFIDILVFIFYSHFLSLKVGFFQLLYSKLYAINVDLVGAFICKIQTELILKLT